MATSDSGSVDTIAASRGETHPDERGDSGAADRAADGTPSDLVVTPPDGGGDDSPTDVPITCVPDCPTGQLCSAAGQCETVCAQGQTSCPGGGCTDLSSDSKNCGLCGKACPTGQFCSQAKCATMCAQGESKCGQSCVKLDTDYSNCDLCGKTCHDAEACVARICRCENPNQICSNVCTNVINNRDNCGSCGNRCVGDYVCNGRGCGCPGGRQSCPNKANTCVANLNSCCNAGQLWCGHCQDVVSDKGNCGSCGHTCPGVEICSNRACGCPSAQPKSCGNGVCIPAGQCCPGTKSCGNGVCVSNDQCCTGQKNCGGGRCIAGNACCDDRPLCSGACCAAGQNCFNNACVVPVDCKVGPWMDVGTCSADCGPGTQKRVRVVVTPASGGGAACPALEDTQPCMIKACPTPVDCVVTFPDFGQCSAPCGGGTQSRTGTVTTPASNGGKECPPLMQTRACNTQDCPVDCKVSEFGPFGECVGQCGGEGIRTRTRTIITPPAGGGMKCPDLIDTEKCKTPDCPPPADAGANLGSR